MYSNSWPHTQTLATDTTISTLKRIMQMIDLKRSKKYMNDRQMTKIKAERMKN